jgi:hypothetical protein
VTMTDGRPKNSHEVKPGSPGAGETFFAAARGRASGTENRALAVGAPAKSLPLRRSVIGGRVAFCSGAISFAQARE